MGPLPRAAEEAGTAGLREKRFPARIVPDDFFRAPDEVRRRFAKLIGAPDAADVALIPAVSYGISTVARNTRLGPGRNVVTAHEQYPSNMYPWQRAAAEQGGTVRVVRPPGAERHGGAWTEAVLDRIDAGTAVVAMGVVHWTDGTPFALEAVRERSEEVGAALVVDAAQAAGALPIDVGVLRPDALFAVGYKFLLGPYSCALGWYGERYLDGTPLEETWIARRGARDFGGLVDYVQDYDRGAVRFDGGQRANFVALPALSASLDLILEWEPSRIAGYCGRLVAEAVPALRELGCGVAPARSRSPHLFGIRLPAGATPARVRESLERRNVWVSVRGTVVRVAPFVYNTREDMEALVEALAEAVGRRRRNRAPEDGRTEDAGRLNCRVAAGAKPGPETGPARRR